MIARWRKPPWRPSVREAPLRLTGFIVLAAIVLSTGFAALAGPVPVPVPGADTPSRLPGQFSPAPHAPAVPGDF